MNRRPWYRSRTLWFNFLMLLATAVGFAAEHIDQVKDLVSPHYFVFLAFFIPLVNKVLRLVTTSGLFFSSAPLPPKDSP